MTKETIRIIEELRKISDSEWEEVKKVLESWKLNEETNICNPSTHYVGRVHHICKEIGMPSNIKGYKYVQRAILLTIENPEMAEKITKLLYPTVAKEFETTTSRLERAIRHAIEVSFYRGDLEKINAIFGCTYSSEKGKPMNSEFITGIADYILNG